MTLSRRNMLKLMGMTGAGTVLAACAPAPAAEPASSTGAEGESAPNTAATDLTIWFHWGGGAGERAQAMIDTYNSGRGAEDGINVTVETVPGNEYRQKMTASRMAGTSPDIYHTAIPILELVTNEIALELLDEDQDYVRQNYIPAAVDRMTFEGKVWGYPTEHQAAALIYRRSFLEDAGISEIPETMEEIRELAKELTREEDGIKYYGYTFNHDGYQPNFHFPGIVWRNGGELYEFEGDIPRKIMVDTPETAAGLGWWRGMVDDGSTQIGEVTYGEAWQNGLAIMTEIEPWFPLIVLRDADATEIYEDLGVTHVRAATGFDPTIQSGGWEMVADRSTAEPEAALQFIRGMMHGPDMLFSRFIVETIGSLPAPLDYPLPIPGWSDAMVQGYAEETTPITRPHPGLKTMGDAEINQAIKETVQAVLLQQDEVEPALQALQPKLDEILERTDGSRSA